MSSVFARTGVALARLGAVVLSLGVGVLLIVRAQRGASSVAAETSAPAAVPVAQDVCAPPEPVPETTPSLAPVEFTAPAVWLSSSKSLDFAEHATNRVPPRLVFPELVAPRSSEPQAVQQPLPIPRTRVYLHSSKSSTTFVPPTTTSKDGWQIVW